MKTKKNILFIPGLGEKPSQYKALSKYMDIAKVDWNKCTYSPKIRGYKTVVTFSLGAMFGCNSKDKIEHLIIYSMPVGVEHLRDIKTDKVTLIIGKEEGEWATKESRRVAKTLSCESSIKIAHGGHKVHIPTLLKILSIQ